MDDVFVKHMVERLRKIIWSVTGCSDSLAELAAGEVADYIERQTTTPPSEEVVEAVARAHFAWTPGHGDFDKGHDYVHYPQYINVKPIDLGPCANGLRVTVRGAETYDGQHYHIGKTVWIDLPPNVAHELSAAIAAMPSIPQESDAEVTEAIDEDGLDIIEALVADATAVEGVANVHEGGDYFAERVIRRAIEQGNLRVTGPASHPAMTSARDREQPK